MSDAQTQWTITPPNASPLSRLREMWQSRRLLGFFAQEAWKWTFRRTALGPFWMLFRPFMAVAVHLVFFAMVLKLHDSRVPVPIYYLSGMTLWLSFDQAILWTARSLDTQRKLIAKIYFPRLLLPVAYLSPAAVDFCVLALLLFVVTIAYWWFGGVFWLSLSVSTLAAVPAVVITTIFALGIGLWAAPSALKSRDILFSMRYVLGGWFLLTPVAYPETFYTGTLWWLPSLNPMAPLISTFRNALIGAPVHLILLAYPTVVGVVVLVSGYFYFVANDARAADRI